MLFHPALVCHARECVVAETKSLAYQLSSAKGQSDALGLTLPKSHYRVDIFFSSTPDVITQ